MKKTAYILIVTNLWFVPATNALAQNVPLTPTGGQSSQEEVLSQKIYQQFHMEGQQPYQVHFIKNPFIPPLSIGRKKPETVTSIPQPTASSQSPTAKSILDTEVPEAQKQTIPIEAPKVVITGIVWNTDRPQAIIDGRVMGIGDTLAGNAVIVNIQREGITISIQGQQLIIKSDLGGLPQFAQTADGASTIK